MGGRRGQGQCLDFGLIMQGPATLWLFENTLGLVWEQMSCGLSGAGRGWPWSRGTERSPRGSYLPGHELPGLSPEVAAESRPCCQ